MVPQLGAEVAEVGLPAFLLAAEKKKNEEEEEEAAKKLPPLVAVLLDVGVPRGWYE